MVAPGDGQRAPACAAPSGQDLADVDDARQEKFSAVYIDVSDATTELAFIQKLYKAIQAADPTKGIIKQIAKGPLKQFFRRIKKVGVVTISIELTDAAQEQWAQLGESLTRALNAMDGRWLLLVDELPIFVLSLLRHGQPSAQFPALVPPAPPGSAR
jgi:hypothetical protein